MTGLDRDAAREVLERMVMKNMHRPTSDAVLDVLEGCVRPGPPQVDVEYEWTAQQWRDWSLKLSGMLSDEWDGDEDELSIIEDFVRHFSKQPRWPEDES